MTSSNRPKLSAGASWLDAGVLAALGTVLAAWTWGQWFHPIIDYGREVYVPWRLVEGEVLYRDIAYFNGPLSPYWNALVFAVFGVGIRSQTIVNLAIVALVTWLVYSIARRLGGRLAALLSGAAFLVGCAFQHQVAANFNWVAPYSHEMTHGVALALLAIWLAGVHLRNGTRVPLLSCGFVLGLCALTKPEALAAALAGCGVALGTAWGAERPGAGVVARRAVVVAATFAVPVALACALLATTMPVGDALAGVAGGWRYVFESKLAGQKFYREWMGTDAIGVSLATIGTTLVLHAAALAPAVAHAFLAARQDIPGSRLDLAIPAALVAGGAALAWRFVAEKAYETYFSPLTATAALVVVLAAVVYRRRKHDPAAATHAAWRLGFAVLALVLLAKMILKARLHHYGFGLGLPAAVLTVVATVHWLPSWLARRGALAPFIRAGVAGMAIGTGIGLLAVYHEKLHDPDPIGREPPGACDLPIAAGADRFLAERKIVNDAYQGLLDWLRDRPEDATVLVLPEGVLINYLSRHRNPTGHINFMPPELIMFGEESLIAAIERSPPDYVVLVQRATAEYGLPLPGKDYAVELFRWVRERYTRPVWRAGPEPLQNTLYGGLLVLER